MIWAIVYGGLAFASLGLLSIPTIRVAKEVRTLSRVVAASGKRLEEAADRLDAASRSR